MEKLKIINCFYKDRIINKYKYVIYRKIDNENWYYGADNDLNKCMNIISDLGPQAKFIETCNCELMPFCYE